MEIIELFLIFLLKFGLFIAALFFILFLIKVAFDVRVDKKIWLWLQEPGKITVLGLTCHKNWQEKFQERGIYNCALPVYLKQFSKKNADPDWDDYQLHHDCGKGYSNKFQIYFDTEFGFTLVKMKRKSGEKETLALAAIGFNTNGKTVQICQIQGRPGVKIKEFLQKLRWEKMLVAIVVSWARKNNFNKVEIQRAEKNEYYKGHESKFYLRYNVTAKRSGFRLNSENNVFVLELT